MIRYINIGDQITEGKSQFAWWNTVTNNFMEFNEEQRWDSWEEFERGFWIEVKCREGWPHEISEPKKYLKRFKGLLGGKNENLQ